MAPWNSDGNRITFLGATHTRGKNVAFGIREKDRDKHMYVIGKSGMGKSTLLENMAIQDIQNGEGMIFIDPHGSTAEKLLNFVPQDRVKDVLYLAPFDTEFPVGFNILEDVGYDNRHKVVAGLMGVFERIWADAWSARMQYILQNTLFALLEYPDATIIDVNRMLVNKAFREDVIKHITDPVVGMFWKEEFAGYSDKYTQDATPAIQNKIGQFVSNPLIRNILGQPKSTFDIRKMMDERKVVIINLSKGRMGESNAALLGSMLVIKVYLAALTRAEEPAPVLAKLPPCKLYVDEFQNVVSRAFENILSESRKYKLCLTIANQYIEQMPEEVRNAVFGNVGTTIIFRVGPMDAQFLEPVFGPTFLPEDMVGLGRGEIYLTLMIDGVGTAPFSAQTLPPVEEPSRSFAEEIIAHTRTHYGKARAEVEKTVTEAGEKWQSAAKDKHKNDSAKGQKSGGAVSTPSAYGSRPRTEAPVQPQVIAPTPPMVAQVVVPLIKKEAVPETPAPVKVLNGELPRRAEKPTEDRRISVPQQRPTPPPQRSPAEVLRSSRPTPVQPQQRSRPQHESGPNSARDALKAAIASARANPASGTSQPVRPPQQPQQQAPTKPAADYAVPPPPKTPQPSVVDPTPNPSAPVQQQKKDESRDDSVDPNELRKLLYGDENEGPYTVRT
ncbi:MAG: type IV secretion system DNA-binding domain-containing protein [Patescibacteria group bacterium]